MALYGRWHFTAAVPTARRLQPSKPREEGNGRARARNARTEAIPPAGIARSSGASHPFGDGCVHRDRIPGALLDHQVHVVVLQHRDHLHLHVPHSPRLHRRAPTRGRTRGTPPPPAGSAARRSAGSGAELGASSSSPPFFRSLPSSHCHSLFTSFCSLLPSLHPSLFSSAPLFPPFPFLLPSPPFTSSSHSLPFFSPLPQRRGCSAVGAVPPPWTPRAEAVIE